jgi:hypothetical protein
LLTTVIHLLYVLLDEDSFYKLPPNLPRLFLYLLFVLNDLLRSHLGMLILDEDSIMSESDHSSYAWVRFPVSALFKANNGRDMLQVEFSTNQCSFG